jgi:hypothetical protein
MVHSTRHWKRLVNGYAGIEPIHYVELREKARRFPSVASVTLLRNLGVRYVILHRGGFGPFKWARIERELPRFSDELRLVATFGDDRVYALFAADAGVPRPPGPIGAIGAADVDPRP